MSYRKEIEDLILRLRNRELAIRIDATPPNLEFGGERITWPDQFNRWAEVLDFLINHTKDAIANLDAE